MSQFPRSSRFACRVARGVALARPGPFFPCAVCLILSAFGIFFPALARAGPPFLTDDPEPVEFKHWEFYAATQWAAARHAASGTCPHFEVNYGVLPEVQLHAIVPAVLSWTSGEADAFGLGDVELGAKLRFVHEGERRPQIGIFPLITLPTGSEERGLGAGEIQGLVPLWVQKSIGPWTTYGGGGIKFEPDGTAAVLGWLFQRNLSEKFTLGAEIFVTDPPGRSATQTQLNLGAILNASEHHHLLVSAGPSLKSDSSMQAYLAYQVTR